MLGLMTLLDHVSDEMVSRYRPWVPILNLNLWKTVQLGIPLHLVSKHEIIFKSLYRDLPLKQTIVGLYWILMYLNNISIKHLKTKENFPTQTENKIMQNTALSFWLYIQISGWITSHLTFQKLLLVFLGCLFDSIFISLLWSGDELGLRALSCCITLLYINSVDKEMSAQQQSSGQDEWQKN